MGQLFGGIVIAAILILAWLHFNLWPCQSFELCRKRASHEIDYTIEKDKALLDARVKAEKRRLELEIEEREKKLARQDGPALIEKFGHKEAESPEVYISPGWKPDADVDTSYGGDLSDDSGPYIQPGWKPARRGDSGRIKLKERGIGVRVIQPARAYDPRAR